MALDQISMFDFLFGSKSKLHLISINSKFRFSLEFVLLKWKISKHKVEAGVGVT